MPPSTTFYLFGEKQVWARGIRIELGLRLGLGFGLRLGLKLGLGPNMKDATAIVTVALNPTP
jgi:hypothetical protein